MGGPWARPSTHSGPHVRVTMKPWKQEVDEERGAIGETPKSAFLLTVVGRRSQIDNGQDTSTVCILRSQKAMANHRE